MQLTYATTYFRVGRFTAACRWVAARMDFSAMAILAAMLLVATGAKSLMRPSLVALALTHVLQLSGTVQVPSPTPTMWCHAACHYAGVYNCSRVYVPQLTLCTLMCSKPDRHIHEGQKLD